MVGNSRDKYSNLLRYGNNYGREKFYSTGPWSLLLLIYKSDHTIKSHYYHDYTVKYPSFFGKSY